MFMLFRFSPKEPIVLVSVQQTEVVAQDEGEVHIEVIVQVDIHLEWEEEAIGRLNIVQVVSWRITGFNCLLWC